METVFVTGGSGFLGKTLIHDLISKGDKIKVLLRKTSKFEIQHPLIEKVFGDVRDRKSFEDALEGVDKIYHLAGVVTDWAPRKLYEDVHVKGTKNVLETAVQKGVKKLIYISTIDVLDHNHQSYIDESTKYTSSAVPYRDTKTKAEKLVFDYAKEYGLQAIVIRPSWIYGKGDTTLLPEVAYQIKKGNMVFIGSPKNLLPLVHVENLSNAIIEAGSNDKAYGEALIISDGETTWEKLVQEIIKVVKGKKVRLRIPYSVAYFFGFILEILARVTRNKHRPLLTRGAVEMMGKSIKINTAKAQSVLRYRPAISLEQGLNDTIKWISTKPVSELRLIKS